MKEIVSRQPLVFEGIQYLRGIAAMMVVFHHSRNEFGAAMSVTFGARGVEIFFVISGLVMMYSTKGGLQAAGRTLRERLSGAVLFWKRRFVRVAPLYWIALLLSAHFVYRVDLTDWTLIKDALFIPHLNKAFPEHIWPTLVPGWSLNYEMFFYFLFGLSLLFWQSSVAILCACIVGLSTLPLALQSHSVPFRFYTAPVMLHFIAGVLLYYLIEALRRRPAWLPPRWAMFVAFIAGFIGLCISPAWAGALWLLLPSSVIVLSSVFLFDGIRLPILRLLGDASYSIYLFHVLALVFTHQAISWLSLSAVTKLEVLTNFALYLIVSASVGVLIHIGLEKPITEYAISLLRRKPPTALVARR
jgi:exopolysaccharide production protein ExoZ